LYPFSVCQSMSLSPRGTNKTYPKIYKKFTNDVLLNLSFP
jgi:hypothetical protein